MPRPRKRLTKEQKKQVEKLDKKDFSKYNIYSYMLNFLPSIKRELYGR